MVKERELSNNEREFVIEAIQQGLRVDGRSVEAQRDISVTYGEDFGNVQVAYGSTQVLAQVSCEVMRPFPDRPAEGFLTITTELSAMAAPNFEVVGRSEEEVLINRHVEKTLRRSRAIDTEGLCIVAGEKVWSVRIDLHFLDHDGNLLDAACYAAIHALAHFRRPDVTVVGDEVTVHPVDERNPVPLTIHHYPLCVTFAFFEQGQAYVVDPTFLEEQVCQGLMSVSVNSHREICAISKTGGVPLDPDTILQCIQLAAELTHRMLPIKVPEGPSTTAMVQG
ncbi:3'-5'-exoribonuclease [Dispira simplex]|nr:3'-5'-exoribonuclease [Dispira simplex]